MTDEELKQIRGDYTDMCTIAMGDYSEIAQLELDPNVQRYMKLCNLKRRYNEGHLGSPLWDIINYYGHGYINAESPIWFRFHELLGKDYLKVFGVPLKEFDSESLITIYYDLENASRFHIIYSSEAEAFESVNTVLKGDTSIDDPRDRYDNARAKYFEWSIAQGREAALKMLKEEEQNRNI